MRRYRRAIVPGGTFFFTVVPYRRRPLFANHRTRNLLGSVFRRCQLRDPFAMDAVVLLPDHLHAIWSLPPGDSRYSQRWAWMKREYSRHWPADTPVEGKPSPAKRRQRRRGLWQPRFWEHAIDDDDDFQRHFDYVHYNPVKHGLVENVAHWPWSSFHRWVRAGVYPTDWGRGTPPAAPNTISHLEPKP